VPAAVVEPQAPPAPREAQPGRAGYSSRRADWLPAASRRRTWHAAARLAQHRGYARVFVRCAKTQKSKTCAKGHAQRVNPLRDNAKGRIMKRRAFLKSAAAGVAAGVVAAPAIAQTQTVRWRLTTSWPKSLDTIQGGVEQMCQRIGQLTDNKFQVQCFAAGEIVPPLQVWDAVQNGTVEAGHTLASFYIGKNTAAAFDAGLAFGLNTRQQQAWMNAGGGRELVNAMYKKYDLLSIPCGNVGVQMGGFYRKEINTVDDLKGLKFRIGGIGGLILSKLGVVPQQIAPGDIYSSLERGTIDAAEWIGPYDDEKLGLHKVARFYYYPGWWEGSAQNTLFVNLKQWEALPPAFQAALECACNETTVLMMAKYDAKNPEALRRLVAAGTQVKAFPRPVLDACYKATLEVNDELAAKNPDFKTIYESWQKFIADSNLWFRVAENTLDNYRYTMSAQPR
jgi:TRAP-type mannitol/chloroaromatic compound transport system substrate-binding protein